MINRMVRFSLPTPPANEFVICPTRLNPWEEKHRETWASRRLSRVFYNSVCSAQRCPTKMRAMKKFPPSAGALLFRTGTKRECASMLSWSKPSASEEGKISIHQRHQFQGLIPTKLRHIGFLMYPEFPLMCKAALLTACCSRQMNWYY